jgi:hypothetical protein
MTIRSSTSTQRWTNRERLDKEQHSRNNDSCRKGEQNDQFPTRAPAIASSMNESSSYPFLQSAIKRTKVSSQRVAVVLRIRSLFSQVVDRRRVVVSSWSSFPNYTNATFNLDYPG